MTSRISFEQLRSLLTEYDGRIALYAERTILARVRVRDPRVEADLLRARCEPLDTPGLNRAGNAWDISAHSSVLIASQSYWAASYANWQLFFDPLVLERIAEIIGALAPGLSYVDDYTTSPAPPGSRFREVRKPGACAAALYAYLAEQQLHELTAR